MSTEDLHVIGAIVGGYQIEAQLGEGGMGVVYRGRHVRLGRSAAIKILLPQFSTDPDVVQRFFNEAKAATSIHHLGIVKVYDFGTMDNGVAYITMELLHGESLASRMKKGVTARAALGFVRLMCSALGAAHDCGIVHRDLKPDNVFIVPDPDVMGGERTKLLDFGIAKLTQHAGMTSLKTLTGALIGTPTYMAPEQCRGVLVDHRADLYSLGCILYELLTGGPPFRGEGMGDLLGAHMYKVAVPVSTLVPGLPRRVSELVAQLLEKRPEDRPQSAAEVIAMIDAALVADIDPATERASSTTTGGDSTTLSSSAVGGVRELRTSRRAFIALCAAIGSIAVVVTAIVVVAMPSGNRPHEPPAIIALVSPSVDAQRFDAGLDATASDGPHVNPTIAVAIDSVPSGAHVLLDGHELGITPYRGTLPRVAGMRTFALRRAGFRSTQVQTPGDSDVVRSARLDALGPGPATKHHVEGGQHVGSGSQHHTGSGSRLHVGSDEEVNPFPSP